MPLPSRITRSEEESVSENVRCIFFQEEESVEHALLLCNWTNYVWHELLGLHINKQGVTTFAA